MFGIGTFGTAAFGSVPAQILRITSDILQEVVTLFVDEGRLPSRPPELHHFTSLETAFHIIDKDDIRLSHAEYSNDQMEIEEAKRLITDQLDARAPTNTLFKQVLDEYKIAAPDLDAFIFCMSTGLPSNTTLPQDMLSQWRAYGQDGRGICLTLDSSILSRLVLNTPGLRLNPVIYEPANQIAFIGKILDSALAVHRTGAKNVDKAAVAALSSMLRR